VLFGVERGEGEKEGEYGKGGKGLLDPTRGV
jgi:hypothetical protein